MQRSNANKFILQYADPEPNFDRSKVIDRVIRLITVKNKKYNKALEAAVGNNLFSIIIENERVGQSLLRRKTFGNCKLLPNN
mmetsp:Transcript_28939/g.5239  ORF Transcript_28939/g.5239 Transcript_28939/m.5239 type:complete len:82 (-) Transcript_28939:1801-2046(-)